MFAVDGNFLHCQALDYYYLLFLYRVLYVVQSDILFLKVFIYLILDKGLKTRSQITSAMTQ